MLKFHFDLYCQLTNGNWLKINRKFKITWIKLIATKL